MILLTDAAGERMQSRFLPKIFCCIINTCRYSLLPTTDVEITSENNNNNKNGHTEKGDTSPQHICGEAFCAGSRKTRKEKMAVVEE